ncbi:MAG: hypothetical protein GTO18_03740, partial [Anaerolineales bacterium]|nr:hypothetical protein [Anaerolineales bacterium]
MIVLGDEVVLRQMKLQAPRMGHDLVPRPNLIDRLDDGLDRSMTLVSAPPGFGKTTVLSEWFMRCPIPAAWLSLDEQDNDLVSFLVYFIAAVGTIFPKSFVKTQDLLHAPNLPQLDSLADTISEELDNLPDDFVLVMDNFRNIVESSIHQVLYMILERNPSRMHLVIASRADPPSPITRMRIGEQLAELRSVDLRFSKEETQLFFEKSLGHILDDEAIIHLTGQSDGWIVRLRLISISIRSADDNDAFLKMLDEKPGNHMI